MKTLNIILKITGFVLLFWLLDHFGYGDAMVFRYFFLCISGALFFISVRNPVNGFYLFLFLSLTGSTLSRVFGGSLSFFPVNLYFFLFFAAGAVFFKDWFALIKKFFSNGFIVGITLLFLCFFFCLTLIYHFYFPNLLQGFLHERLINSLGEGYDFLISYSVIIFLTLSSGYIIFYFASMQKINKTILVRLCLVCVFINFVAGIFQTEGLIGKAWEFVEGVQRYNAFFSDPNSLGIASFIFIVFFMFYLISPEKRIQMIESVKTPEEYVKAKMANWADMLLSPGFLVAGLLFAIYLLSISVSRSGMIGTVLAFIGIVFWKLKKHLRKQRVSYLFFTYGRIILAFIIICYVAFTYVDFLNTSALGRRMSQVVSGIERGNIAQIIDTRFQIWQAGYRLIKTSFFPGTGMGGFYTEIVNIPGAPRDVAGSLYIEYLADFGIFGAAFLLFFFYKLFILSIRYVRCRFLDSPGLDFNLGLVFLFWAMLIIFNLGSHIYFMEIAVIFFTALGLMTAEFRTKGLDFFSISRKEKAFCYITFILAVLFFGVKIIRTRNYDFLMKYSDRLNMHPPEWSSDNNFFYSWTRKKDAIIKLPVENNEFILPLAGGYPDANKKPVRVKIYSGNRLLDDFRYDKNFWDFRKYSLTEKEVKKGFIFLKIATERIFNPKRLKKSMDSRNMGIAVAEPDWNGRKGFYYKERSPDGVDYWYMEKEAVIRRRVRGKAFSVSLTAPHPDLASRPVRLTIFLNGRMAREQIFSKVGWVNSTCVLSGEDIKKDFIDIGFTVDRIFNPFKSGASKDARNLGVAVSRLTWQ